MCFRNLQEHIGPDEMETAPVMMESHKEKYVTVRANSCRPAMRSYSSTPEMRSLTNLQWKRYGLPLHDKEDNLKIFGNENWNIFWSITLSKIFIDFFLQHYLDGIKFTLLIFSSYLPLQI